jgi:hypothetical protein
VKYALDRLAGKPGRGVAREVCDRDGYSLPKDQINADGSRVVTMFGCGNVQ